MKRDLALAACGLLFLLSTTLAAPKAAPERSTHSDALYGFSLKVPEFPGARRNASAIPLIMSGPSENGFASNVNVNVQSVSTTREGYRKLSLDQMRQLGFNIHSDRDVTVSGRDAIRFDYEGKINGQDFHFLALAVVEKDRVILVTCTAKPEAFKAVEPEFQTCLDSFRLD